MSGYFWDNTGATTFSPVAEEDPIKGVLESREHLTCFQTQYFDGSYVDGFDECHYSSFFRQYLMPSLGSLTSSDCVSRCLLSASVEFSPPRYSDE